MAVNSPSVSATTICWPVSVMTATTALGEVTPVRTMLETAEMDSSSGEEIEREKPLAGTGAGVRSDVWAGVGVGEAFSRARSFRLLLAVQTPKVIISPSTKPRETANATSFFIG